MYPIEKPLEILKNFYFDNPRTFSEIKEVAKILREANYGDKSPFPESDRQAGKGYITLDFIVDEFYNKYKDDIFVTNHKSKIKYKNPYNKMASMWVILRNHKYYEEDYSLEKTINFIKTKTIEKEQKKLSTAYDEIEKCIKFVDMLTFIAFNKDSCINHSILLQKDSGFLYSCYDNGKVKNIIVELLVAVTSKNKSEEGDYRFLNFKFVYKNMLEANKLLKDKMDNSIINFIADNLSVYGEQGDLKLKLVILVSIFELIATHKPDNNRYNIEDSIKKQFSNKILIMLYLNNKNIDYANIEKELQLIYDLRSNIAHGDFSNIKGTCIKLHNLYITSDFEYSKFSKEFDDVIILEKVVKSLEKYIRIILKIYLDDEILFSILKK
jgi:hypothetical protein